MNIAHTSLAFDNDLRVLCERLLAMGARCEQMTEMAFQAFRHGAPSLAAAMPGLEARLDHDEVEVEELALRVMALRQPVAGDLRLLATSLRLVTDLERVGDAAVKIAEYAPATSDEARSFAAEALDELDARAQSLLRLALEAFVRRDVQGARRVLRAEDAVFRRCTEVETKMTSYIEAHPRDAASGLRVLWVADYLKRIADHATNLAEEVVFVVEGEDVRHPASGGTSSGAPPTRARGTAIRVTEAGHR
jgi:phosphate transport system protein